MACDLWRERIEAYADGELPEAERRELELHLKECAACASEAVALLQEKRITQAAGQRFTPSPEFRRRVQEAVSPGRRPAAPSAGWWRWSPAFAAAALVLVALVGVSLWRQKTGEEQVLSQVVDLHVTDLASASPVDVVSSDRHTVKPWFQGRLPFSFEVPELKDSPYVLVGGRLVYLEHEPGAQLVHQVRQHKISVFILRNTGRLERLPQSARGDVLSIHVESWTGGGLRYFVVGDAGAQDIQRLAELYRAAAGR